VPARAERIAASIGTTTYGSRAALLDQGIDLAFVLGDPWEMLDDSRECLRRGIAISVEKPAAPSLHELEELVADAERAAVTAFVPLVLRTSGVPGAIEQLGVVSDMHAQYLTGPASRYTAGGYGWAVKDSILGAGCLGNLGPHFVDLFSLAVGSPHHAPQYFRVLRPHAGAADDRALIVLRSTDGSWATLTLGYTTPHAQFSIGPYVVLTGKLGTLVLSDTEARLLRLDGSTSQPCPPLQWQSLYPAYVRAVLASPDGGGHLPNLADLRNTYRVLCGPAETDLAL
jgi:predicted dehydrogenase